MATEKQCTFFKSLYDEEAARERQLNDLARNYLSLVTFYSAFLLFVLDRLKPDTPLHKALFYGAIAVMIGSFVMALWATRISDYEGVNNPTDVLAEISPNPITDETFFDNRIADYVVACDRNTRGNDLKSGRLSLAGYGILLRILLQTCYLIGRAW